MNNYLKILKFEIGTYGGNCISCAAAVATINVMKEEGLIENSKNRGEQLKQGLKKLQQKFPQIGDIRGMGLMIGVEFTNVEKGTAALITRNAFQQHKMLLMTAGPYETVRFMPPLIVNEEEIEVGLTRFEATLTQTFNKK